MNSKFGLYITDQSVLDVYFLLCFLHHRNEEFKNYKTNNAIEDFFTEKGYAAESKISRNSLIFIGEKNANWFSKESFEIINNDIKKMISGFKIKEFMAYFKKEIIGDTFFNELLSNLNDDFRTKDLTNILIKNDFEGDTNLEIDLARKGRVSSSILKLLCNYGISKISNGIYTKKPILRKFYITLQNEIFFANDIETFNEALIHFFVKKLSIKKVKKLIFYNNLESIRRLSKNTIKIYDRNSKLERTDWANALYDYFFGLLDTYKIDLKYKNVVNKGMYINSTINYLGLPPVGSGFFKEFSLEKNEALKAINDFISSSVFLDANDDVKISLEIEKTINGKIDSEIENENATWDSETDIPSITVEAYSENQVAEAIIKIRKRNKKLKKVLIEKNGYVCEACGLDILAFYGEEFSVIHLHHKKQLSSIEGVVNTAVDDVALVCPSCHASIHKNPKKCIDFEEFKNFVAERLTNIEDKME